MYMADTKLGNGDSSETDKLLLKDSNKDQAQQRSEITIIKQGKKNNKNCIVIIIVLIVVFIILSAIAISLLVSSYSNRSGLDTFSSNLELGDSNSGLQSATSLITIDNGAYLFTISLLNPKQELMAYVYSSSTRPLLSSKFQLQEIRIPFLEGDGRFNYNYYPGDEGIYLNPGSSINYTLDVIYNGDSNDSSLCPYRLFLFNDIYNYNTFRNRETFKSVDVTPCTPLKGELKNLQFIIKDSSTYYVGIEIDTDYLITSNVTVTGYNYDTSQMSRPSNCDKPLSFISPSCNFSLCSSFYCDRTSDTYLAVEVTAQADLMYSYQVSDITGKSGLAEFTIGCFLFVAIGVIIIVIGAVAIYFLHQKRARMKSMA
ncbi:PREDICTED: uncharacterized protein LOC109585592 [Amphimedon queenslandica]|uniref:Uncharacterized protein n=1 Tax=Amphimedon queenslandica TaxID=400682 RepID=A0A1X7TX23_AMPQE|nr:PREDICTED: uncharacterized protein LOC109585592 [Amphimedon queenslandica]|eukprot:XP_019857278.1 PREDICTED: uncharacterized protein LOC109585592 [Amphimedon queenslandica]